MSEVAERMGNKPHTIYSQLTKLKRSCQQTNDEEESDEVEEESDDVEEESDEVEEESDDVEEETDEVEEESDDVEEESDDVEEESDDVEEEEESDDVEEESDKVEEKTAVYDDILDEPEIRDGIKIEYSDRVYYVRPSLQDWTPDYVCDFLKQSVSDQEEGFLEKLYLLHTILSAVSKNTHSCFFDDIAHDVLCQLIEKYFGSDGLSRRYLHVDLKIPMLPLVKEVSGEGRGVILWDIFSLINIIFRVKVHVTARTIARVLQGIPTCVDFSDCSWLIRRFRYKYNDVDFNVLSNIAAAVLEALSKNKKN